MLPFDGTDTFLVQKCLRTCDPRYVIPIPGLSDELDGCKDDSGRFQVACADQSAEDHGSKWFQPGMQVQLADVLEDPKLNGLHVWIKDYSNDGASCLVQGSDARGFRVRSKNLAYLARRGFLDDCARVQEVQGKGLGVVATKPIARGERILAEPIALKFYQQRGLDDDPEKYYWSSLTHMPMAARDEFYTLSDCVSEETATVTGRVVSNSLPLGPDEASAAVFLTGARFNHSCLPNVHTSWQEKLGVSGLQVFHALRDVGVGEELTISYLGAQATVSSCAERQAMLLQRFKFQCDCKCCLLEGPARKASDRSRENIKQLVIAVLDRRCFDYLGPLQRKERKERAARLQSYGKTRNAELAKDVIALVNEELCGHASYLCYAYYEAFVCAVASGNDELAEAMIAKAFDTAFLACGGSSEALDLKIHWQRLLLARASRSLAPWASPCWSMTRWFNELLAAREFRNEVMEKNFRMQQFQVLLGERSISLKFDAHPDDFLLGSGDQH
eukprot:TRINITY_DN50001_c0_g1_i1.p1 TRINITY_DN50001_c0_g1~~TRINITY_DN50001_c0_g1_i1.p1  ORF type:complete len:502 (+),score=106.40 TRINITY_DN50001_c0_g1_i1:52-1557(+)